MPLSSLVKCFYIIYYGVVMDRNDIFEKLVEAIDPIDELNVDTVLQDSDDIDSLALFNIALVVKTEYGLTLKMSELLKLKTINDIIDYVIEHKAN